MKILQITKYYYPALGFGGTVQCVYNISKRLVKKGHEVTVYTTDALDPRSNAAIAEESQTIDGVDVFYFHNYARPYRLFVSPGIISALRKNVQNFDIVHLHEYRTFQNLAFHCLNTRLIPYILSAHGSILPTFEVLNGQADIVFIRRLFDFIFGRELVRGAKKLIATTKSEAKQYIRFGVEENKIVIIPNGISLNDFSQIPSTGYFRKFFGITEEKIILYMGRIHRSKGIGTLVKAFSLSTKEQNNVKLVIAGADDGFSGPLRRIVKDLDIDEKVLFAGFLRGQLRSAAYNEATVVVCPGLGEIFGIVPIEAAYFEKPVIVTNDCGMAEVVSEGTFGLLVNYGNISELKSALISLLNNEDKARKLGENGKEYVLNHLTWDYIVNKLESMYLSII